MTPLPSVARVTHYSDIIEVLRVEPDLAVGIEPELLDDARRACLAPVTRLPRGAWDPAAGSPATIDGFGFLLLNGFLVRRVDRAGLASAELLGPGDLLRPSQTIGAITSPPFEPSWSVLAKAELAVLDFDFVRRAAPWPSIAVAVLDRTMLRSRHLGLMLATIQQTRVDRRVHAILWQIADRWGRVGPGGVTVDAPLTHELLGELVAARRPSVTTALASLEAAGAIERDGGRWLLRGGPPNAQLDH